LQQSGRHEESGLLLVDAKLNIIKKVSRFFSFLHRATGSGKRVQNTDAQYRLTEPFLEDQSMNKLLVALFAGAFALISASALAQPDNTMQPLSKMDTDKAKAARAKKLSEANALDMVANENMQYNPPTKEEAAASKALPKPTKEQRQKDLAEQAKKSSGQ
jgi:hypothetical protein